MIDKFNVINENYLFNNENYSFYKINGVLYQVDLNKKSAKKVRFEDMLYQYLLTKNSFLFKNMVLTYIRLCVKLFNINLECVENTQDLDDLEDMFFKQGQLNGD